MSSEFPPCSYTENHQPNKIPQSFMYVRATEGTFNPTRNVFEFEARAICTGCLMKTWDAVMRPKMDMNANVITMMDVEGLIDQKLAQWEAAQHGK